MVSIDDFLKQMSAKVATPVAAPSIQQPVKAPVAAPAAQLPARVNPLMALHGQQIAAAKPTPPKTIQPDAIDQELARIDQLEAAAKKEKPSLEDRIARLDALISAETGLNITTIDQARGYVKDIMIALRDEPGLDALLIDRDVHNILAVMRNIRFDAAAAMAAGAAKSEKRATKKSEKEKKLAFLEEDFADIDLGDFTGFNEGGK